MLDKNLEEIYFQVSKVPEYQLFSLDNLDVELYCRTYIAWYTKKDQVESDQ